MENQSPGENLQDSIVETLVKSRRNPGESDEHNSPVDQFRRKSYSGEDDEERDRASEGQGSKHYKQHISVMLLERELFGVYHLVHGLLDQLFLGSALVYLLDEPFHKRIVDVRNEGRDYPSNADFVSDSGVPLSREIAILSQIVQIGY